MNALSEEYWKILKSAQSAENSGDFTLAEQLFNEALKVEQSNQALIGCASVALKTNRFEKASQYFEAAYKLQPSYNLLFQLIVSLLKAGNLLLATKYAQEGLAKKPKEFSLINIYGVILKQQGQFKDAIEHFNKAAKLNPKSVSPFINLGNTYIQLENPRKAIEYFIKATKIEPGNGEHYRLLAGAYMRLRENDKAFSVLRQAQSLSPRDPKILLDISSVYYNSKEYEKALDENINALKVFAGNVDLLRQHAAILRKLGQNDQTLQIYESILRQNPNDVVTINCLGNLYYYGFGNREKANEYFASALKIDPENIETAMQYCECLLNSRYGNEYEHIEKAYELAQWLLKKCAVPQKIAGAVQSIFLRNADYESFSRLGERKKLLQYWLDEMNVGELHNQLGRVETMEDRYELIHYHHEWGKKIEEIADKNPIERVPAIRQRNKTRIAIMSSDLKHHPVTYFVQPILEHYDRSKFEIYCYSFSPNEPDMVQRRLTEIVDEFRFAPNLSDREIAKLIAADEPDILFELGGTTHMNKVTVLAYRPAPIQVSWLGYPHSCGISAVDYILVDPYINPEQSGLLIEKPFVIPETWVSLGNLGFHDIPIEPEIPEDRQGYITFGTMNNPYKYTPKVFETWANIMNQTEGSHFLFVRPEGAVKYFRENVLAHFAKHGITNDRIEFFPVRGTHMQHYNRIDISLDPFPHTGGTSTCEAIWMGVPVITLVGPAFFERLSYSNLNNAGLGNLCAFSVDEYIEKVVSLAKDKDLRKTLHNNLRIQILNNPLGQPERFVRNFESKIMEVLSSGGLNEI